MTTGKTTTYEGWHNRKTAAEYAALALTMRQRAEELERRYPEGSPLRAAVLATADSYRRMADACAEDARKVAA